MAGTGKIYHSQAMVFAMKIQKSLFKLKRVNLFAKCQIHWKERRGEVIFITVGAAVGERILELCREREISVNKLCSMSGVTQSTVNNIINRRNNSTTISTIKKLCDGLGISLEEFFHSDVFRNLEQEIR